MGEVILEVGKLMLDFGRVWREYSVIHKSPDINNGIDYGVVKWEQPNDGVFKSIVILLWAFTSLLLLLLPEIGEGFWLLLYLER